MRNQDSKGKSINTSLTALQLKVRVNTPIFQLDYTQWQSIVMPCWLTTLWEFLTLIEGTLESDQQWIPQPKQQQDPFLIELTREKNFQGQSLKQINVCCKYLQVVTVLDITTVFPEVGKQHTGRKYTYTWPQCGNLYEHYWKTWHLFLNAIISQGNTLQQPLERIHDVPHS